jgi:electron transport complex protein RnfA
LELCDIPRPFQGAAITLVIGGILAIAFMGFTGVDSGIKNALKPAPVVQEQSSQANANTLTEYLADITCRGHNGQEILP